MTLIDCVPQQLLSWQEALRRASLQVSYSGLQLCSGPHILEAIYLPGVRAFSAARDVVAALAADGSGSRCRLARAAATPPNDQAAQA
jgi:hypothetical protein